MTEVLPSFSPSSSRRLSKVQPAGPSVPPRVRKASYLGKRKAEDISLKDVLTGSGPYGIKAFEHFLATKEHSLENLLFLVAFQSYQRQFLQQPLVLRDQCRPPPTLRGDRWVESNQHRQSWEFSRGLLSAEDVTLLAPPSSYKRRARARYARPRRNLARIPSEDYSLAPASTSTSSASHQLRTEVERIISTFLLVGSTKELNLDDRVRERVLVDLSRTVHPDAFLPAYEAAYAILENHSLGHFLSSTPATVRRTEARVHLLSGCLALGGSLLAYLLCMFLHPPDRVGWRALRLVSCPLAWYGARSLYLSARNQQPIIRHELRLWTFEEPAFALRPPPTIVSSFSTSTVDMNTLDDSKHPQLPDLSSFQAYRKSSAAAIPDWDGAFVPPPPPAASSQTSLDSTSSSGPVYGPTCFLPHPKIVRWHQQISIQGLVVASVWTAAWVVLCLVVPSPSHS